LHIAGLARLLRFALFGVEELGIIGPEFAALVAASLGAKLGGFRFGGHNSLRLAAHQYRATTPGRRPGWGVSLSFQAEVR